VAVTSSQRAPLRLASAALTVALLGAAVPAFAQTGGGQPGQQVLTAETFVALAHSLAQVQGRAAELAATRDTRPEAKAFGQRMVAYRHAQIPKLRAAAAGANVGVPAMAELEHRLILENLEPLDYLALTRRYAEFQVAALEQERAVYRSAAASGQGWQQALAGEALPELERLLGEARQMREAVGP
jgi:putative membrane protein